MKTMTKIKDTIRKLEKSLPLPIPTSEEIVEVFRSFGRDLKDLSRSDNDKKSA